MSDCWDNRSVPWSRNKTSQVKAFNCPACILFFNVHFFEDYNFVQNISEIVWLHLSTIQKSFLILHYHYSILLPHSPIHPLLQNDSLAAEEKFDEADSLTETLENLQNEIPIQNEKCVELEEQIANIKNSRTSPRSSSTVQSDMRTDQVTMVWEMWVWNLCG